MRRSLGVTTIAVLSLLGSVPVTLLGLLMVGGAIFLQPPSLAEFPDSPALPRALFFATSLVYLVPGVWGTLSGIGLFRLKKWARVSTIVFSVWLIVLGGFGCAMSLVIPMPSLPTQAATPAVMTALRTILTSLFLAQVGLGIWWLVLLTRAKVKQQFARLDDPMSGSPRPPEVAPPASTRPLSVTILAWFMLWGVVVMGSLVWMRAPAVLFTAVLTGWSATSYSTAAAALQMVVAIGLLRRRRAAHAIGIGYVLFVLANSSVFYFAPGRQARMRAMMEIVQAQLSSMWPALPHQQIADSTPLLAFSAVAGCLLLGVELYILISRKPTAIQ